MNLSIRGALYIAGGILLTSAIVSQFQNAELIWSTLLTLSAIPILYFGYREEKKRKKCRAAKNKPAKIVGVTIGAFLVFLAFGFSVGKLIYLWTQ